ncbi:MAG: hypothetical protein DRN27_06220 [Thermoplasmata archaeon]|nr:MAG: hypothetical protein DRN27_06220 [Thermoplasmata archaeon]
MEINKDKYIELFYIAENIQDKILNEEYDDYLEQNGYSDPWEVIEDLINNILDLSEEKELLNDKQK